MRMTPRQFRVATSLLSGLLVVAAGLISGWSEARGMSVYTLRPRWSHAQLQDLERAILAHRVTHGALPVELAALAPPARSPSWGVDDSGRPIDAWQRPIHYSVREDGTFLLISYAQDGEPGGVGLDSDLTPDPRTLAACRRTYADVRGDAELDAVLHGSLLAGALTALIAYGLGRPTRTSPYARIGASLVVVTVGAMGLAAVLAVLDLPSGH